MRRRIVLLAISALVICVAISTCLRVAHFMQTRSKKPPLTHAARPSKTLNPELATVVAGLEHREGLISSASATGTIEISCEGKSPVIPPRIVEQITWRFDHDRFYEEWVRTTGERGICAFDGRSGYDYDGVNHVLRCIYGNIDDLPTRVGYFLDLGHNYGRKNPDAAGYYGLHPLSWILVERHAKYVGEKKASGLVCKRVDTIFQGIHTSYLIAPTKGYMLVQMRSWQIDSKTGTKTRYTRNASGIKSFGNGIFLPTRVERLNYVTLKSEKEILEHKSVLILSSIEVNQPMNTSDFTVPPPARSRVESDRLWWKLGP